MKELALLAPWLDAALMRLLELNGHAWLITGGKGLGQFELSQTLAASWLCETNKVREQQQKACGHCPSCHLVNANNHPDLMTLLPETLALELERPLDEKTQKELAEKKRKPSKQIRVDAVHQLTRFTQKTSARGLGLVAVIYPAQAMNHVAANALLKSLEEPAGHTRFILVTDDNATLLSTIRSRCQKFSLPSVSHEQALTWLLSKNLGEQEARIWLQAAGGLPQRALMIRDQLKNPADWENLPSLVMKGAASSQFPEALCRSASFLVESLQKICHDALCVSQGAEARFFSSVPSTANFTKLTRWSKSLNQHARTVDHPLDTNLRVEVLLTEARLALAE